MKILGTVVRTVVGEDGSWGYNLIIAETAEGDRELKWYFKSRNNLDGEPLEKFKQYEFELGLKSIQVEVVTSKEGEPITTAKRSYVTAGIAKVIGRVE